MQCDYFPTYFCHEVYLKGNFFLQFFKCFQKDIVRSRNSNNVQISFRSSQFPPSTIRGNFIVVSLKQVNGGSCFYLLWSSVSNRNQEDTRPHSTGVPRSPSGRMLNDISHNLSEMLYIHTYMRAVC